ncbi:MAG: GNAT family N-acetyltransferase [Rhodanobacteraceae bacterium]
MTASIHIRAANPADAGPLARLSGQLGYPADAKTIARRLQDIGERHAGAVLVAEVDGAVAGWAHALPQARMEHDANAELAGLVVEEHMRGTGIGAALLHAVEDWARKHGYPELIVRSNVIRARAYRFYLREGYAEKKRQAVFTKRTT